MHFKFVVIASEAKQSVKRIITLMNYQKSIKRVISSQVQQPQLFNFNNGVHRLLRFARNDGSGWERQFGMYPAKNLVERCFPPY